MSDMNREEFLRLQKEAEERLRQMQRRSEQALGIMPPTPDFVKLRNEEKPPAQPKVAKNPPAKNNGFDILKMFNFKNIQLDSDRVLIIAVLLLLMGDSSDELLMLALIYIML